MAEFHLQGLDHVAIAVRDLERSQRWYEDVLGLERVHAEEWELPVFLVAGGTGVALFPAQGADDGRPSVRIKHIAFRVEGAGFEAAQRALAERRIRFRLADHGIARSLYFDDPDGHELELTTYDV